MGEFNKMRKSIFKKIDEEGNLEIPEEFLNQLGIENEDELEIITSDDEIMLRKLKKPTT